MCVYIYIYIYVCVRACVCMCVTNDDISVKRKCCQLRYEEEEAKVEDKRNQTQENT